MTRALGLVVLLGSGCLLSDDGEARPGCATCDADSSRGQIPFRVCEDQPAPPASASSRFLHVSAELLSLTTAWHSGLDTLAVVGDDAVLGAKFTYGTLGKDLEDEWIEVWIDRCDRLESLGSVRTDHDGRIALALDAEALEVGRHRVHFRVEGDGTQTSSTLIVLPPGARLAVFDIDGTLTTSDWELFEDLIDDLFGPLRHGVVPQAREGATEITWARADQGYVPVYLTGRPYWLTERTRGWLADMGMAPGVLVTTQSSTEVLPTESGVGDYKADTLARWQLAGLGIDLAYGNASTDIYAYAAAGIDGAATFILGRHGGEDDTVALGEDYLEHLDDGVFAPIQQPFARSE